MSGCSALKDAAVRRNMCIATMRFVIVLINKYDNDDDQTV